MEGSKPPIYEEDILQYLDTIKKMAWRAYAKLRKPSIYLPEDLIQEGIIVLIRLRKKYKANRGASFRTYLVMALRCHYATIVNRSYRHDKRSANLYRSDTISKIKREERYSYMDLERKLDLKFVYDTLGEGEKKIILDLLREDSDLDISDEHRKEVCSNLASKILRIYGFSNTQVQAQRRKNFSKFLEFFVDVLKKDVICYR